MLQAILLTIVLGFGFLSAQPLQAQQTGVYCEDESLGASSSPLATFNNDYCKNALKMGNACFIGHPHVIVDLLNKQKYFVWGEESIRSAHYKSQLDAIEYLFVNYSTGEKLKRSLPRCEPFDNN